MRKASIVAAVLVALVPSISHAQVVIENPAPPPQQPVVVAQPLYPQQYVQPGYAQPGYAQPGYVQSVYVRPQRSRPGGALIGTGAGVFAAFWAATAFTGLGQLVAAGGTGCPGVSGCNGMLTEGWLNIVPIAGPFINAAIVSGSHDTWSPGVGALYVFDGLIQSAGFAMLVVGAVIRRRSTEYARAGDDRGWALLPMATPNGAGLALSLTSF
jgi:hypothetical protein